MSKAIQIVDIPDDVHRVLENRAAREGVSLSDYLKLELERAARQTDLGEWVDHVRRLEPLLSAIGSTELIREIRDRT